MTFKECLQIIKCDLGSRKQTLTLKNLVRDPISRFHFYLRLTECLADSHYKVLYYFLKWRYLNLSRHLGFSIPENTLERGVYLPHYGTIVVNSRCRVGEYSVLNVGVVIGRHPGSKEKVPMLGAGVYVGPGAKVFGAVTIGCHSVIGANSVVAGDIPEGELWVGVPARCARLLTDGEYTRFINLPELNQGPSKHGDERLHVSN